MFGKLTEDAIIKVEFDVPIDAASQRFVTFHTCPSNYDRTYSKDTELTLFDQGGAIVSGGSNDDCTAYAQVRGRGGRLSTGFDSFGSNSPRSTGAPRAPSHACQSNSQQRPPTTWP